MTSPAAAEKIQEPNIPVHDCPIQGPGTPLSRTLNVSTGERGDWICIWCELAKRITGGSR